MTTITFDEEKLNLTTIKNVLKALGVNKITVQDEPYKVKFTKKEFDEKLDRAEKSGRKDLALKTAQDVDDFFDSL